MKTLWRSVKCWFWRIVKGWFQKKRIQYTDKGLPDKFKGNPLRFPEKDRKDLSRLRQEFIATRLLSGDDLLGSVMDQMIFSPFPKSFERIGKMVRMHHGQVSDRNLKKALRRLEKLNMVRGFDGSGCADSGKYRMYS
jgi:hypothetical protein